MCVWLRLLASAFSCFSCRVRNFNPPISLQEKDLLMGSSRSTSRLDQRQALENEESESFELLDSER